MGEFVGPSITEGGPSVNGSHFRKLVVLPEREQRVTDKLNRFRAAGPRKIKAVFDFDRTATSRATILQFLTSRLPSSVRDQALEESVRYRELEMRGLLTPEDVQAWWAGPLDLFAEHRLNFPQLSTEFAEIAPPRPGFVSTFAKLEELGVPRHFLSGGIEDMIAVWCKQHGVNPTSTISTKLHLDEMGNIVGWDKESLVHSHNKRDMLKAELSGIHEERPLSLVAGDSMDDAHVIEGEEDVLRIRVKESIEGETDAEAEAFRQETFTRFDLLIEDGHFGVVEEFLDSLRVPEEIIIPSSSVTEHVVWSATA